MFAGGMVRGGRWRGRGDALGGVAEVERTADLALRVEGLALGGWI